MNAMNANPPSEAGAREINSAHYSHITKSISHATSTAEKPLIIISSSSGKRHASVTLHLFLYTPAQSLIISSHVLTTGMVQSTGKVSEPGKPNEWEVRGVGSTSMSSPGVGGRRPIPEGA